MADVDVETLEVRLALRWPEAAEPVPLTAREMHAGRRKLVKLEPGELKTRTAMPGWDFRLSGEVFPVWSTTYSHGAGHNGDGPDAQNGMGRMYRTKAEAALACRWAMCRDFALQLRGIDVAGRD